MQLAVDQLRLLEREGGAVLGGVAVLLRVRRTGGEARVDLVVAIRYGARAHGAHRVNEELPLRRRHQPGKG